MLERWNLPYFHMVECAHNAKAFKKLSKRDCDLAAREAIQIIKDTASMGVGISVLESDYLEIVPKLKFYGSAYDACARHVICGVSTWIRNQNFSGSMHYFFERGASTQRNASYSITQMMNDDEIKSESCYSGHSFIAKANSPALQAADILAWHAGQDCKRAMRGDPVRKDFASLSEIPHVMLDQSREMLAKHASMINDELREASFSPQLADEIEALSRRTTKKGAKIGG